jgi:hypothetical protein
MKTKICKNPDCKKEFTPMYNSLEKYCSYECIKACSKSDIRLKTVYSKPIVKKCKICKEKFEPKNISTEVVCGKYDCKVEYAMQVVAKNKVNKEKAIKKQNAKEKIELKEKLKTLSDWHSDLQKEINTIVRLIDKEHPCISSQRPLGKSYDAGHLFGRQSNPHIRYHLFNIWAQSVHDNQWKSGNQLDFVDGIEKTFGSPIKDYCLSLKGLPSLKLTIEQIKEFIPKAREVIKHLKLDDRKYSNFERLSLREEYNLYIGIHTDKLEL